MDLNNLIFAALLGCVLFTGGLTYFSGIQANYAPAQNVTGLSNAQYQINQTTSQLNNITQSSKGAAMTQSVGQDPVGALLGYFNSAFQAIKILVTATINVPDMFGSFIGAILSIVGFVIPTSSWLVSYVIIAVCMITFIGIMYYLTKVR